MVLLAGPDRAFARGARDAGELRPKHAFRTFVRPMQAQAVVPGQQGLHSRAYRPPQADVLQQGRLRHASSSPTRSGQPSHGTAGVHKLCTAEQQRPQQQLRRRELG